MKCVFSCRTNFEKILLRQEMSVECQKNPNEFDIEMTHEYHHNHCDQC